MKLVPLIGYTKVDHEKTRYTGNWNDTHTKLWGMVKFLQKRPQKATRLKDGGIKYEDQEPQLLTAEFCIKACGMFDFCGGVMFMSPQINTFYAGSWGETGYASPGGVESITYTWDDLKEDPDRVIDLEEYTGKKLWSCEEIEDYGMECIASACLALLLSRGTNGWVCSDAVDGRMYKVHKIMCDYTEKACPVGAAVDCPTINSKYKGNFCHTYLRTQVITTIDKTGDEYYNSNSGNSVVIMVGTVTNERDGQSDDDYCGDNYVECPECGEEGDLDCCNTCHNCDGDLVTGIRGDRLDLSGQIGRALNHRLYAQVARRFDWSNG